MRYRQTLGWMAPLLALALISGGCADRNRVGADDQTPAREAPNYGTDDRNNAPGGRPDAKTPDRVAETGDNVVTTAKIKNALIADKVVPAGRIDVDTENDVVTLNGEVDTAAQKERAERIAKKVQGVKKIVNRLKVKGK